MPQPLYQYVVADADVGQQISLGSGIAIPLDGSGPFSITGWFRVRGLANDALLLGKGAELSIGAAGTLLYFQLAGQPITTQSSTPIVENKWHFLAVTADVAQGAGLLTLYLDGVQVAQSSVSGVGTAPTAAAYLLGGGLNVEFLSLTFYNGALDPSECDQDWTTTPIAPPPGQPAPVGIVANFDFVTVPAQDITPAANPVTFLNGARQVAIAEALSLYGSWAIPDPIDALNPGGSTTAPFTVQAWVLAEAPTPEETSQTLTLFANGTKGAPGALALTAPYDAATGQCGLTLTWSGFSLTANLPLPLGVWTNVAVTYDGATVVLYINGTVVQSGLPTGVAALPQPNLVIGAATDPTTPGGIADCFKGAIQAFAIWNTALSASGVATYMALPAGGVDGCVGYFDFATVDLSNQVTGGQIQLYETADVLEVLAPAQSSARRDEARFEGERAFSTLRSLQSLARGRQAGGAADETSGPLQSEHVTQMLADFDRRTVDFAPDIASWLRALHKTNLQTGLALAADTAGPLPGTYFQTLEDDEWVIRHQGLDGAVEVGRFTAVGTSACTAWIVSIVATSVGVIMSAIGLGYSVQNLYNATRNQVIAAGATLTAAIEQALTTTTLSGTTFIKIVRSVYGACNLATMISSSLAGVSWWSWAFSVTNAVVNICALWLTGGWWTAFILAQLALSVAQLTYLVNQRPPDC